MLKEQEAADSAANPYSIAERHMTSPGSDNPPRARRKGRGVQPVHTLASFGLHFWCPKRVLQECGIAWPLQGFDGGGRALAMVEGEWRVTC